MSSGSELKHEYKDQRMEENLQIIWSNFSASQMGKLLKLGEPRGSAKFTWVSAAGMELELCTFAAPCLQVAALAGDDVWTSSHFAGPSQVE